jgi:hypothetical protein
MSAPALAPPDSVQKSIEIQNPSQQDIAELAYALWQRRGSPIGSPEKDWMEAELCLRSEPRST